MGQVKIKYAESPKYLSEIGRYHYAKTVEQLRESGLYNPMDSGLIEMLSMLYQDTRNEDATLKERQNAIKLYFQLKKDFGGTPASRQALRIKPENAEVGSEDDLKGLLEDE